MTAQRREQSLQDVPISVTAVTGEAIEEGGFSDVEDMSIFVPNLFMRDAFTGQSIIVRGIGTSTGNEAFEQAVASFSDGVYYGRDNLGQNAVFDLERVEVVRGPQPTFAGQSATAGAINVITRKPGETWDGNAALAYGNDEETSFDFAAGGPIADKFGIRFAGRYYDLDDAGYTSIVGNVPQGVKENTAGARHRGLATRPTTSTSRSSTSTRTSGSAAARANTRSARRGRSSAARTARSRRDCRRRARSTSSSTART